VKINISADISSVLSDAQKKMGWTQVELRFPTDDFTTFFCSTKAIENK
jgi:hypothetical protein